ncbi:MAG: molybdopterin-dependent oxidoreductase, partial [Siphonobacter aquaeclarae]|nr:molybdopterin-dependent oxidoreductase [Siphonobacter aquaeclarae]
MLSVSWLPGYAEDGAVQAPEKPGQWNQLSAYIHITVENAVKLICPNPEFGQNVMTSLPMILAEELDVDWKNVIVEMGPHDNVKLGPQFTGGSNSVRMYWKPLREAGATVRLMLRLAAAQIWNVPVDEIGTKSGLLV